MKEKFFLASNNTLDGFENCFDQINPDENAQIYIIKGGSGTGKSTLMKKIGKYFFEKGFSIEYFFCSSDPQSLDGVRIVEKGVSVVDGTAPHVTEATLPGIKEKIVNVGEFVLPTIKPHKAQIELLCQQKKHQFDVAYANLKVAKQILEVEKLESPTNQSAATERAKEIFELIGAKPSIKQFDDRHLFLSSIDVGGVQNLIAKNSFKKVVCLDHHSYLEGFLVLNELKKLCNQKHLKSISILSPFDTSWIEGLLFEDEQTLVFNNQTSKNKFKNHSRFQATLSKAGKCIDTARKFHKKIEKYYIQNMNFDALDTLTILLIDEIDKILQKD